MSPSSSYGRLGRLFRRVASRTGAAAVAAILLSISPEPTRADVLGDMRDFWDRAGGGANITRPQALSGQRAGYVTGGSLYVRSASRSAQIASLQLPSLRTGCGGIDIFTGAFSFLSKEELIAMSKAIAANAAGFAFQLALESIAPSVAETMGNLRDLAQKVNSTNISSCEAAAGLVGGLFEKTERVSETICKTIGTSQGIFQDWASSKHGCSTAGQEVSTNNSAPPEVRERIPYDINYAWDAARKNSFLTTNGQLAELFMSMTGTIIVKKASDERLTRTIKAAKAYSPETLRALVEGGSVSVYRCDELSNCLNVTNGTIDIPRQNAFFAYVLKIIEDMAVAIRDEASLPPEAADLLNLTNLPIHKALVTAQSYRHHFYADEVFAMAEAVALDVAYRYVSETSEVVSNGANALDIPGEDLKQFQANLRDNLQSLGELAREGQRRFAESLSSLERLRIIEVSLAASGGHIFLSQFRGDR